MSRLARTGPGGAHTGPNTRDAKPVPRSGQYRCEMDPAGSAGHHRPARWPAPARGTVPRPVTGAGYEAAQHGTGPAAHSASWAVPRGSGPGAPSW